jgi:periplasmic divalent cation tolerance protein
VTDDCIQVTVAASSREEADRLVASAVGQRLAACGQVAGPVNSTYHWEGRVRHAEEWLCILKTTRIRYPELERLLLDAHSYDNPEIIATAIPAGSADYLAWLRAETAPSTGGSR